MKHEGEREIAEEDGVRPVHVRKVTFKSDSANGLHCDAESDAKPPPCTASREDTNGHRHETSTCSDKDLCDGDRKQPSGKVVGILRPRSVSLSPLVFEAMIHTRSRFKQSELSKAIRRSNETRGLIEKLKQQIFQHFEQRQRTQNSNGACETTSQSKESSKSEEKDHAAQASKKRRMVCVQSTKDMMNQTLPSSMMPFVEETLRDAHFLHRRRKENRHGRIIHKILIEQHKQILKQLQYNQSRNGGPKHSYRPQSDNTKPS